MVAPLYDIVHGLALDMANASASGNEQTGSDAYDVLKELCKNEEGGELDHPLQWEALGDFSENHEEALRAYKKGLSCASKLDLPEYSASIKFALAESYFEQNDLDKAQELATEASSEADSTNDNELKVAINELLNELRHT